MRNGAESNFEELGTNQHSGSGIVSGVGEDGGNLIQIFWATDRILKCTTDRVIATGTGSLAYDAMLEFDSLGCGMYVVGNGTQVQKVVDEYCKEHDFQKIMRRCEHQRDEPDFTPRITVLSSWSSDIKGAPVILMSVIRKYPTNNVACSRYLYEENDVKRGFGYCIRTFPGHGDMLYVPPFGREPYLLPLKGNERSILDAYWERLNQRNNVSVAVKFIPIGGGPSIVVTASRIPQQE